MQSNLKEFPTKISSEVDSNWMKVTDVYKGAALFTDKNNKFKQGNLGNCWLAAAIESLRHENNKEYFEKVVQNELTYKFWENGDYRREIILENNAIPVNTEKKPEFIKCVDGKEYWGILLEKAYAKWAGSYEGLTGGYWSDAMQSFTGGVIENIKLQDRTPKDLFNIMLQSFQNGSSLCCILKKAVNDQEMEQFHTCCCIKIEEDASKITIRDPYNISESYEMSCDEFAKEYHELLICHTNLDNYRAFQGKNIAAGKWQNKIINLHEGKNVLEIELTEPDDDGDGCSFLIEVVQTLKPDGKLSLCKTMKDIEVDYDNKAQILKVPQKSFPFNKSTGKYSVTLKNKAPNAFVRVFSKKNYPVQLIK